MGWLTPLSSSGIPSLNQGRATFPFQEGKSYWQLDLDGRDAVEGVARHYLYGHTESYFASKVVRELEAERRSDIGRIAIYTMVDDHGDDIAYVFASAESSFVGAE